MDMEKTQYGNGQGNSTPATKPIIDQMTDLAAEAAGTLAETARYAFYVAYLTSGAAARLAESPCLENRGMN